MCRYFPEPRFGFAGGREHVDRKTGLACFGPLSLDPLKRHPNRVRIGFVGTSETVEKAEQWISINARGVPGDEKHPDFFPEKWLGASRMRLLISRTPDSCAGRYI